MSLQRYESIFAAIDFGPLAELTLSAAWTFARHVGAKHVQVVHVAEPPPDWAFGPPVLAPSTFDRMIAPARDRLAKMVASLPALEGVELEQRVVGGHPARELAAMANQLRGGIVVLGARRRGAIARAVLGSVSQSLLRASSSPVLIVGDDRPLLSPPTSVMAAIDLSPSARMVITHAQAVTPLKGQLSIFSASEVEQIVARLPAEAFRATSAMELTDLLELCYQRKLRAFVDRYRSGERPIDVGVTALGIPREVIVEEAQRSRCDLLVIGTSGHHAWRRWILGSTAGWVAANASCPVLVCPPENA